MTNRDPARVPEILRVDRAAELPDWAPRPVLERFLHEKMKPYHDTQRDVGRGLDYAFSDAPGMGGFVLLARLDGALVGALVMLRTGMGGYIPENLLLFVGVEPALRGRGIGRALCERGLAECEGAVKLHVESDNPAKRLYERLGFRHAYDEMRYGRP